jgi:N-acetyl-gamma-glutamyl-phosphate reductase
MKIGIVGASGYSGGELLRVVSAHPEFSIDVIAAHSNAGEEITSIHPQLGFLQRRKFDAIDPGFLSKCDLLFFALPHGESAKIIGQLPQSIKIVDLGADFRLRSTQSWEKYYGGQHAGTWVYGLPELPGQRAKISASTRIANPGCYATAISLGSAPLSGIVDLSDVVVVAASGTTGAGRNAKINLIGSEVMNSLTSYKFGGVHQHTPEIEEAVSAATGDSVGISFTPILAPMPRGILATITSKLKGQMDTSQLHAHFTKHYAHEEFVQVLPIGQMPKTSAVLGSNLFKCKWRLMSIRSGPSFQLR